jgi:ribosomal protein S18 acetylase RimI-like enzyme
MWEIVRAPEYPEAEAYIRPREFALCFLSSRLKAGLSPKTNLLAFRRGGEIQGLVLAERSGFCFPAMENCPPEHDAQLAATLAALSSRDPGTVSGFPACVSRLERALGIDAADGFDYYLLRHPLGRDLPRPEPREEGIAFRLAAPKDLEEILPLAIAYEKEEVLSKIHSFDARATRHGLSHALAHQLVMVAIKNGKILGKAQTNARGFGWDQLGGVYVAPEFRGRGIAGAICSRLVSAVHSQGRSACLFVKQKNESAIGAYRKINFEFTEDFRISYYR